MAGLVQVRRASGGAFFHCIGSAFRANLPTQSSCTCCYLNNTGVAWSADESRVAYVAEAPPPAKTPEWGGAAAAAGPEGKKAEGAAPKDWGELNTGEGVAAAVF